MSKPKKGFAFVDVETLGLKPKLHDMVELAIILTDRHLEPTLEFQAYIMPEHPDLFEPKALEMTGFSVELWEERGARPLAKVLLQALPLLVDYPLAGHNVQFDENFIVEGCRRCWRADQDSASRDDRWRPRWHYRRRDTMSMMDPLLYHRSLSGDALPGQQLRTLCEAIGIEWYEGPYKSALEDVRRTRAAAKKLREIYAMGLVNWDQLNRSAP